MYDGVTAQSKNGISIYNPVAKKAYTNKQPKSVKEIKDLSIEENKSSSFQSIWQTP